MNILVTGSKGFVGSNLIERLNRTQNNTIFHYDQNCSDKMLTDALNAADVIYHLAGVNRPSNPEEFYKVNADLTDEICNRLIASGRKPKIILTSSIQAEHDNPYGRSKFAAEEIIKNYVKKTGATGVVYRLKNLFGKWCRPNYNSVTATFCHNIAHGLPIQISNPSNTINLTYIDDVTEAFYEELDKDNETGLFTLREPLHSQQITLGELASLIQSFRDQRENCILPDFSNTFVRRLYATYLSYLNTDNFKYFLNIKNDNRGNLAEFIKSNSSGQIFISKTKPGVTRGNHYHNTKTEKFMVVEGIAIIRLRKVNENDIVEFRVDGTSYSVIDIPPGYTHSIENIGDNELITIFWASEIFDSSNPETYYLPVME